MKFFSADGHYRHRRILEFCPSRGFIPDEIHKHDELLINNHNSIVTENDETYHIGDFCFGTINDVKSILNKLNGKHHLIVGNHDRFFWKDYITAGFDTVSRYQLITLKGIGPVGLAHDPAACISEIDIPWLVGHLHQQFIRFGNAINVGVDVRNMKPISEEELKEDFRLVFANIKANKKATYIAKTEILGTEI